MDILFVSDFVCPYCLVAKEALKQALAETALDADITWHPYELTPEYRERVDTYHDEKRKAKYKVLLEPCAQLGLDMKLPPKVVPRPYTRLAFEGWYYACDHGKGDAYNDRMYTAYFIEELDIGDLNVLTQLAGELGLDKADFAAALENGTYTAQEKFAVQHTRNVLQPKGVPTIYIDGEKVSLQTYTKEEMVTILRKEAEKTAAPAFVCGTDGCGVQ
jgi:predicted DsbA family dithiol-disulfide isomerase